VNEDPNEFETRPSAEQLPGLLFVPVPDLKLNKNRLHLDFRPDDRDAEVARLLALGATHADVGQGEQSWVVLADPDGNEFCVSDPAAPHLGANVDEAPRTAVREMYEQAAAVP
jgi:hypothetical protein